MLIITNDSSLQVSSASVLAKRVYLLFYARSPSDDAALAALGAVPRSGMPELSEPAAREQQAGAPKKLSRAAQSALGEKITRDEELEELEEDEAAGERVRVSRKRGVAAAALADEEEEDGEEEDGDADGEIYQPPYELEWLTQQAPD